MGHLAGHVDVTRRRMNVVRAAARCVSRHEPAIVRRVTSAYERRRRTLARARKEQEEKAAEAAETVQQAGG